MKPDGGNDISNKANSKCLRSQYVLCGEGWRRAPQLSERVGRVQSTGAQWAEKANSWYFFNNSAYNYDIMVIVVLLFSLLEYELFFNEKYFF